MPGPVILSSPMLNPSSGTPTTSMPSGGVLGSGSSSGPSAATLNAIAKLALPPQELSIGELLAWMQKTMDKTDSAIRDKMNAMLVDQNTTKKYTDAIAALNTMEQKSKADTEGKVPPSKELWEALDPDTIANLPDNVRKVLGAGGEVGTFMDDAVDGSVEVASISNLRDALKDAIQEKNSSHEMQMIELQSDVSSRQQKFQLVSAIVHSLDETGSQIVGKIA